MNINILYEDNHLLVVEKPINVPVQADRSRDEDLLTMLKRDLKIRYNKPGNVFLGLVHRLDRPVGGVIVFAKTSKAASRLANFMRKREVERTYLAVVRGNVKEANGTLENYLLKDARKNIVSVVSSTTRRAKKAVLQFERVANVRELSLLSIQLHTGRPHQIRVQLSAYGHPLYGDQKYGKSLNKRGEQLALWAHCLSFKHPTKKEKIELLSYPPHKYPWNIWNDQYIHHF